MAKREKKKAEAAELPSELQNNISETPEQASEPNKEPAPKKKSSKKEKAAPAKAETAAKRELPIQPELNIALVGHVDHGKTTVTERLSGKWTDTHSEELKKGITIRLGYADFTIAECPACKLLATKETCRKCNGATIPLRKISLVDAPGHESLMATMLSGAAIVDGALLLVAANEKCPQPQTKEHLMALQITSMKNVIVVQNKIDLVTHEEALENYRQIRAFLSNTPYKDAPIIPVSARANVNIDILLAAIQEYIQTPERRTNVEPLMLVARSFDINKPGARPQSLVGGVLGGTVKQGKFKKGDEIEIRPGYMVEEKNKPVWKPLRTTVSNIFSGGVSVPEITPGGSMALGTLLDPSVVKADSLGGSVVGLPDKMPPVHAQIVIDTHLLERVVGAKEEVEVKPLAKNEMLMLNVNAAATVGVVLDPSKKSTTLVLRKPICANLGDRITLSRRVGDRFRLIGYGILK